MPPELWEERETGNGTRDEEAILLPMPGGVKLCKWVCKWVFKPFPSCCVQANRLFSKLLLDMSPRTPHRRFDDEGTSFRRVLAHCEERWPRAT